MNIFNTRSKHEADDFNPIKKKRKTIAKNFLVGSDEENIQEETQWTDM